MFYLEICAYLAIIVLRNKVRQILLNFILVENVIGNIPNSGASLNGMLWILQHASLSFSLVS